MQPPELVEGRDYYVDPDGLYVFTAAYLLARGTCCRSGCRHCPYGFVKEPQDLAAKPSSEKRSRPALQDGSTNDRDD